MVHVDYNADDKDSFEAAKNWVSIIRENNSHPCILVALVGEITEKSHKESYAVCFCLIFVMSHFFFFEG